MKTRTRPDWLRHVKRVVRSRHYAWLAEARDGEPIEQVMADVLADVMHICQMEGLSWDDLLDRAQAQYEAERAQACDRGVAMAV